MISFELSEQQKQIKEMTHWFAEHEMRPIAMEADRLERVPDDWLEQVNKMGIHLNTSSFSSDQKSQGPKRNEKVTEWECWPLRKWRGETPL